MLSNLNFFTWKTILVSAFILIRLLALTVLRVCLTAERHTLNRRTLKGDPHPPVSMLKVLNKYHLRNWCFVFFLYPSIWLLIFIYFINITNETQSCYYSYSQALKIPLSLSPEVTAGAGFYIILWIMLPHNFNLFVVWLTNSNSNSIMKICSKMNLIFVYKVNLNY